MLKTGLLKGTFQLTEGVFLNHLKAYYRVKFQVKSLTSYTAKRSDQVNLKIIGLQLFHTSFELHRDKKKVDEIEAFDERKSFMYYPEFEKWGKKDKKSFLETVRMYKQNVKNRASHVDFIKAALKNMKEFGVHRDIECYKKIIDVLPKGVYVCTNKWMVEGMYYPRQQNAALDLLEQMGNNGVFPDAELGVILKNIFGARAYPYEKFSAMLYWAIKWKNSSPFSLPDTLPSDPVLLAKLAIERITSVDLQTEISILQTDAVKESIDKTWIVSGQSPKQKKLLEKHPQNIPVVVEGSDLVWLKDMSINYFILKADGEPLPFITPEGTDDISNLKSKFFNPNYTVQKNETKNVHTQDDGTIYAVCATGTSSKDSLLSWVRLLERTGNAVLANVPVLFRFKQEERLPATFTESIVPQ